jgi:hypothetical protein
MVFKINYTLQVTSKRGPVGVQPTARGFQGQIQLAYGFISLLITNE